LALNVLLAEKNAHPNDAMESAAVTPIAVETGEPKSSSIFVPLLSHTGTIN
jgi:hypothetical protein